jgi:hypothetical protein
MPAIGRPTTEVDLPFELACRNARGAPKTANAGIFHKRPGKWGFSRLPKKSRRRGQPWETNTIVAKRALTNLPGAKSGT